MGYMYLDYKRVTTLVRQAQAAWQGFAAGMLPHTLMTLGSECQVSVSTTKHQHGQAARAGAPAAA